MDYISINWKSDPETLCQLRTEYPIVLQNRFHLGCNKKMTYR